MRFALKNLTKLNIWQRKPWYCYFLMVSRVYSECIDCAAAGGHGWKDWRWRVQFRSVWRDQGSILCHSCTSGKEWSRKKSRSWSTVWWRKKEPRRRGTWGMLLKLKWQIRICLFYSFCRCFRSWWKTSRRERTLWMLRRWNFSFFIFELTIRIENIYKSNWCLSNNCCVIKKQQKNGNWCALYKLLWLSQN